MGGCVRVHIWCSQSHIWAVLFVYSLSKAILTTLVGIPNKTLRNYPQKLSNFNIGKNAVKLCTYSTVHRKGNGEPLSAKG